MMDDEQTLKLLREIAAVAQLLRTTQTEYFKTRTQDSLARSKGLEAKFDKLLAQYFAAPTQPELPQAQANLF